MTAAPETVMDRALGLLEKLVAFDSDSSKSNLPVVAFVEAWLKEQGIHYVVAPNAKGDKAALMASVGPMVNGGIALSGHTDVVPVAGQAWSSDPFTLRREGSRLYGRGTCDMKGFDAVALAMLPELARMPLKAPVHVLLSYDEELTCLGSLDLIARFGKETPVPRAVIVGEPTLMQVADSHKCISTYYTTVHGVEAHSARPALGANAIAAAGELVHALTGIAEAYEAMGDSSGRFDPGYSTVSVGTIAGGTARNILAKECRFHWEYRGLPGMRADDAYRRFQHYVDTVALPRLTRFTKAARIETETEVEVPGLAAEPGSAAETLALRLTQSNRTIAVSFATEAGQFQQAGLPTVVCGPGSIEQAHQPDEFVELGQLEACAGFVRGLAQELC
jgi:acetylornithine deacetylase